MLGLPVPAAANGGEDGEPAPGWDSLDDDAAAPASQPTPTPEPQAAPTMPPTGAVGDAALLPLIGHEVQLQSTGGALSGRLLSVDPSAASVVASDGSLVLVPREQILSASDRPQTMPAKDGRGFLIAGGILGGLGLGATLTGIIMIAQNNTYCDLHQDDEYYGYESIDQCKASNSFVASWSLVPGVIYMAASAPLITVGAIRRSRAKKARQLASTLRIAPTRMARGFGARLSLRF
jgi:hypothetical protein